MYSFLQKLSLLSIFAFVLLALPLQAQEQSKENNKSFIEQGTFLTGFSLSFINASRDDFNQDFEREFTNINAELNGLYFLSDRFGAGPLLGYGFTYRDLVDLFNPNAPDNDTRNYEFEFGAKAGWYLPACKLFGGSGNAQFFINGGVSWLRTKFSIEGFSNFEAEYRFGYRLGTGFLFPVGRRIALQTKLGFRARKQEYVFDIDPTDGAEFVTETKWPKEVALSVGLQVTF